METRPTDTAVAAPKRPKVFYGWYIVAAAAASGFINFVILTLGQALFVKDVSDEFAWGVTAIALGFSLRTFESGILGPIGGYMIDHFGARTMALIGCFVTFAGLLNFASMHHLWQFYLSSVAIATGQGLGANQAYLNPVVKWFVRKRGRASSIITMGRGWSYIGLLPISLLLVTFGWREASFICAFVFLLVSFPSALVLRDRPEPYGYLPDGEPLPTSKEGLAAVQGRRSDQVGFGVKEALRMRAFWMILLNMAIYSFMTQTYHVHFLSSLRFSGFSASAAALVQTVHGIIQVVGRLAVGWFADRFGRTNTMRVSQLFMGLGWLAIAFIRPGTMWVTLPLYYFFFGLGQAAYTTSSQTIVADFFGTKRFATLRGIMNPISVVGSIFGPIIAGLSKDHLGTYVPAFLFLCPLIFLGALTITFAGKPTMSGEGVKV